MIRKRVEVCHEVGAFDEIWMAGNCPTIPGATLVDAKVGRTANPFGSSLPVPLGGVFVKIGSNGSKGVALAIEELFELSVGSNAHVLENRQIRCSAVLGIVHRFISQIEKGPMSVGPSELLNIELPNPVYTGDGMDTQVKLIFDAVKKGIESPRERQAAIVRAGLLAQAYANYDDGLLQEVFGSGTEGVLKNDVDLCTAVWPVEGR